MTSILVMTDRAVQRFASLFEAMSCLLAGWFERNLIAEFPADEDLP
jgi:hypothetical protein